MPLRNLLIRGAYFLGLIACHPSLADSNPFLNMTCSEFQKEVQNYSLSMLQDDLVGEDFREFVDNHPMRNVLKTVLPFDKITVDSQDRIFRALGERFHRICLFVISPSEDNPIRVQDAVERAYSDLGLDETQPQLGLVDIPLPPISELHCSNWLKVLNDIMRDTFPEPRERISALNDPIAIILDRYWRDFPPADSFKEMFNRFGNPELQRYCLRHRESSLTEAIVALTAN